ncbi:hypothetical protein GCM10007415_40070 [Parapedobacter pyrenivorans]|uniref:Thioredoxin domain-containing protein n=2 Tax=Parapedobacter pyrenivorans TaxID=1305674 RepID=A0A917I0N9_9SPHI|nr:hypothetical protein GCM10007415_40070 [Parapedobacter pyrenivorans]
MCLYAHAQSPGESGAAASGNLPDTTTPLQIGDTIPEYLWHQPLQVVNHTEGKATITLDEYRGKLIILDFWGTFCTTCIFNMPYLHGLENTFSENLAVVPVTREDSNRVMRFLQTNVTLKDLHISSITKGDALYEVFPSQTLPHIVLIDEKAKVRAITMAEYLNKRVIEELLAGKPDVYIPPKRQSLQQPLLQVAEQYRDAAITNGVYHRALSGFIDGLSHDTRLETDSASQTKRFLVSNIFVAKLYTIGLRSALPLNPKRRILEASLPERYVFPEDYRDIDARRQNFYTYESISPLGMSESQIRSNMKDDLDIYLGLTGSIERRMVNCLVLFAIDSNRRFVSAGNDRVRVIGGNINSRFFDKRKTVGSLPNGVDTYVRYSKFAGVADVIDQIIDKPLPVILNETGYEGEFDLDFPSPGEASLETVNDFLHAKGLELCWAEREMDMFVLTENGFHPNPASLQLTDIGYTYLSTNTQ